MKFFTLLASSFFALIALPGQGQEVARGFVFHDKNGNSVMDAGENGLEGIRVSNGRQIVKTDAQGGYELPVTDDTILFVIKPKGWASALSEDMLPQFYYIHKPHGSPKSRFKGVSPTGPLPESINFALQPQQEADEFKVVLFGDPQSRDAQEVNFMQQDVLAQLIGTDAAFGITLGDIVFDDLNVMEIQNKAIAKVGLPWFNIIGNHDLNFDSKTDKDSDETFHRIYGPNYYSFDYGDVHFVALDNIYWTSSGRRQDGKYIGRVDEEQLEFIKADLELVPKQQLVVLLMHIPLQNVTNREEIFRLIEDRPNCISLSGHTHWQEHLFLDESVGWKGNDPHHHIINVTVCGSWWAGMPDETGIPHATMRDGAPNGYAMLTLSASKYDWKFIPARRNPDHQMHIHLPDSLPFDYGTTEVLVNVFGGSDRCIVEMKLDSSDQWTSMQKVLRPDPQLVSIKVDEAQYVALPGRPSARPIDCPHMWAGSIIPGLKPGSHKVSVKTTDMFGKEFISHRIFRVE